MKRDDGGGRGARAEERWSRTAITAWGRKKQDGGGDKCAAAEERGSRSLYTNK